MIARHQRKDHKDKDIRKASIEKPTNSSSPCRLSERVILGGRLCDFGGESGECLFEGSGGIAITLQSLSAKFVLSKSIHTLNGHSETIAKKQSELCATLALSLCCLVPRESVAGHHRSSATAWVGDYVIQHERVSLKVASPRASVSSTVELDLVAN